MLKSCLFCGEILQRLILAVNASKKKKNYPRLEGLPRQDRLRRAGAGRDPRSPEKRVSKKMLVQKKIKKSTSWHDKSKLCVFAFFTVDNEPGPMTVGY